MKALFIICVVVLALILLGVVIAAIVYFSRSRTTYQASDPEPQDIKFPECFDLSPDAKSVYKILRGANVHKVYGQLFDAYTMLLCQIRDCNPSPRGMQQKIDQMRSWGGEENNQTALSIVNSTVRVQGMKARFLILVCYLCEKQMADITKDKTLTKEAITQLVGLNSQFYRINFATFNQSC